MHAFFRNAMRGVHQDPHEARGLRADAYHLIMCEYNTASSSTCAARRPPPTGAITSTGVRTSPAGHQVTTGRYLRPNSQPLLRWNHVRSYLPGQRPDAAILVWNVWPTKRSELQVHCVMRERRDVLRRGQPLINAQLQL